MTKHQLIRLLEETGSDNAQIYIRGNNNSIIPVTDTVIMGDGSGVEEICLINGEPGVSVKQLIANLFSRP